MLLLLRLFSGETVLDKFTGCEVVFTASENAAYLSTKWEFTGISGLR